jgi:PAS domain S-box-containing protein
MIQGNDFVSAVVGKEFYDKYSPQLLHYNLVDLLDCNGVMRFISDKFAIILGYEPEELIGKQAFDMIHPEDREFTLKTFSYMIEHKVPTEVKYEVLRKDGTYITLRSLGIPLMNNGEIYGYVILSCRRYVDMVNFRKCRLLMAM